MIKVTRRTKLPAEGTVFAVPLSDGSYGLAQLACLWTGGNAASPTYLLFNCRFPDLANAEANWGDCDLSAPSFASTSDGDEIAKRNWVELGIQHLRYKGVELLRRELTEWGWWRGTERGYLAAFLGAHLQIAPAYKLFLRDLDSMRLASTADAGSTTARSDAEKRTDDETLVRAMEDRGDDPNATREVTHYLLLKPERTEVPAELSAFGPVEVVDGVISVRQLLRRSEIAQGASRLREAAIELGLEYDGWEAPVVRSS